MNNIHLPHWALAAAEIIGWIAVVASAALLIIAMGGCEHNRIERWHLEHEVARLSDELDFANDRLSMYERSDWVSKSRHVDETESLRNQIRVLEAAATRPADARMRLSGVVRDAGVLCSQGHPVPSGWTKVAKFMFRDDWSDTTSGCIHFLYVRSDLFIEAVSD